MTPVKIFCPGKLWCQDGAGHLNHQGVFTFHRDQMSIPIKLKNRDSACPATQIEKRYTYAYYAAKTTDCVQGLVWPVHHFLGSLQHTFNEEWEEVTPSLQPKVSLPQSRERVTAKQSGRSWLDTVIVLKGCDLHKGLPLQNKHQTPRVFNEIWAAEENSP